MGRGDLVIGGWSGSAEGARRAACVAAVFERAGVPCKVSSNLDGELWTKLIINCAYNAACALSGLQYGPMVASTWARELMAQVVDEALTVARAEGVALDTDGLLERVLGIGAAMPAQRSSTAQDIGLGKPTEIDALNGYLARRGAALGVPTPVNRTLHALVKLRELAAVTEAS